MPDTPPDICIRRRPVRLWVGLAAGTAAGPLIGYALVLAPDSELLGAYPADERLSNIAPV